MMARREVEELIQCGRRISVEEVEMIRETVGMFPALSRNELVATDCEDLGWYTAAGNLKREAKLLKKLEAEALMKLPEKRKAQAGQRYSQEIIG